MVWHKLGVHLQQQTQNRVKLCACDYPDSEITDLAPVSYEQRKIVLIKTKIWKRIYSCL